MKSLLIAFSTLTLLPVSPKEWRGPDVKASVAFYPLVGAFLGGLLTAVGQVPLGFNLKTILLLLVWVVATGAFHLDGLADCCDGFFGGKDPKDRRRIMKDPFIGAYGVTAIVLCLLFKFSLLPNLLGHEDAWRWLLLIPMAARWAVALACTFFRPPKGDQGLGSQVMGFPQDRFLIMTLFCWAGGFWLLRWQGLSTFLLMGSVALGIGSLSRSKIKGLTGDGMGAIIELSELAGLFLAGCIIYMGSFHP